MVPKWKRTAWLGVMAASGQTPNDTSGGAVKVDRATAYYRYTLASMYSEVAAAEDRNSGVRQREYEDKALENYKAAVKADPQTPMLHRRMPPLLISPIGQPSRTLPKADPSGQRP